MQYAKTADLKNRAVEIESVIPAQAGIHGWIPDRAALVRDDKKAL